MDAGSRRPQLPALGYLDTEKTTRREEEVYHSRHTDAHPPQSTTTTTAASPSYPYPSGPPPPYSHPAVPAHHTHSHHANSGVHTPPASRRTSGDDNETVKQTTRQSLPSISEALGVESQTPYSKVPPPPPPAVPAAHTSQPAAAAVSPLPEQRTPYGPMEPQPQPRFVHAHGYHQQQIPYPPPPDFAPAEPAKPPVRLATDPHPALHPIKTSHSPVSRALPPSGYSYPPSTTSPSYEPHASQSAGSMAPPSFHYGYAPYPPRYGQPTPPSSASAHIYQPSVTHAAPPTPTWKTENSRYGDDRAPFQHTESVKRHLDFYDFEAALVEIARTSDILANFSKRYGDQLHQSSRSGPNLSSLPSVPEVDDLITKTRVQVESLVKVRDVVLAQHAAYDQQVAEQHQQRKAYAESMPPPSDIGQHDLDDSSAGGFAGPDTKKRRGRAAPPGRCHSCNRAETPEWRRGPDGARTLCNACGLHYAKLTRKQNQASKQAAVGNSNLRPKEA